MPAVVVRLRGEANFGNIIEIPSDVHRIYIDEVQDSRSGQLPHFDRVAVCVQDCHTIHSTHIMTATLHSPTRGSTRFERLDPWRKVEDLSSLEPLAELSTARTERRIKP
jgi:hypothetical protein